MLSIAKTINTCVPCPDLLLNYGWLIGAMSTWSRFTGPLWWESTGRRRIPLSWTGNMGLWFRNQSRLNVLLTSTPSCVVSPRGESASHEGVDVNNTHPTKIDPDYNMIQTTLPLSYQQATGFDAWASRVKCPARFVSHLHEICISIWVVYSFCLFCCWFIVVTWWYVWCIEWASGN